LYDFRRCSWWWKKILLYDNFVIITYAVRSLVHLHKEPFLAVSMTIVLFFIRYFPFHWNLEAKNKPQFTHISIFLALTLLVIHCFHYLVQFLNMNMKKSSNKSSWELGEMKRRNECVKRFLSRSSWCTFIIIKHGKCFIIMNELFTLTEPI